jgi:hypothetical protein
VEELMTIYREKCENGILPDDFGLCPKCFWVPGNSENMHVLDHEIDEEMPYYLERLGDINILIGELRDNQTGAAYAILECEECKTKYACQLN